MNVEVRGLVRTFRRTRAVAGVDLSIGPGVFGLAGVLFGSGPFL